MERKKILILGLVSMGVIAYYFFLDPASSPHYFLKCPLYEVTGYQCPGCGSQRSFHELLHLNFAEAFHKNGLFVLAIPYALILTFTSFQKDKFQRLREVLLSPKFFLILVVIIILFGIFRNL